MSLRRVRGLSPLRRFDRCDTRRGGRSQLVGLVLTALSAAGCESGPPRVGPPPEMPVQTPRLETPEVRVESVAQNLEVVWGLAVAPDGRVFVSERPGRIRVIEPDRGLSPVPWAEIDVFAEGEAGLLGLELHPSFADSPYVYVVYSHLTESGAVADRVSRFSEERGRGVDEVHILDGIPAGRRHAGGAIGFGPDGKLYFGTGDAARSASAQDPGSLGGKILRINPDGSIPEDNPFPESPVYALGLRNVQGFDWDPWTGRMLATMHGPSGEWARFGRDELNVIERGANYGWPRVLGAPDIAGFADPWLEYSEAVAPAAAVFYRGPIDSWDGDFFFATLRGEHVHRVVLTEDRATAKSLERLWPDVYGRIRALAVGPDGTLFFGTSNRDGRGYARPGDDQVFRVTPSLAAGE